MRKPRLLLGDDHPLMIEGLRSVLAAEFEIAGIVSNGRELIAEAERLQPDAVLLDVWMPLLNGIEAARRIRQVVPRAKLVFVTQVAERAYVQAALELGASGYGWRYSASIFSPIQNSSDGRQKLGCNLVLEKP